MNIKELKELRARLWALISRPDGISMTAHSKDMRIAPNTLRRFIEEAGVPHSSVVHKIMAYLDTMKG